MYLSEDKKELLLSLKFNYFQVLDCGALNFKTEHGADFMEAVFSHRARIHMEKPGGLIRHHF